MSPVPEQNPMIPAVYPRPSLMSSMYLYCAFQSSDEFSALDTISFAISFLRGSVRSTPPGLGDVDGLTLGDALGEAEGEADGDVDGLSLGETDGDGPPPTGVPKTWNSNSEYPYGVPRLVPLTRTNRPVPERLVRSSVAPLPVVVEKIDCHVVPSVDVSTVYALPYAASQFRLTWVMVKVSPRSTRIHCGSTPSLLAQRVVAFPSTALAGPSEDVSTEDAVAGLPWDSRDSVAAPAVRASATVVVAASVAAAARPMILAEIFTGAPPWAVCQVGLLTDSTIRGHRCQPHGSRGGREISRARPAVPRGRPPSYGRRSMPRRTARRRAADRPAPPRRPAADPPGARRLRRRGRRR